MDGSGKNHSEWSKPGLKREKKKTSMLPLICEC